jgi:hypothetical protein
MEVAKFIVSMEVESTDEIKNCSHIPSMNELGDGKVPTGERILMMFVELL